jgi:peptidoglycan/LPS O-acetylase OafA/YrhL
VIWHHAAGVHHTGLLALGHHGVSLFFALSGFLITTLLLREQVETGAISLRDFYIRRTLRIFPLYYAVVLLYVILVLRFDRTSVAGTEFFSNLPYFLTYTSNLFVIATGPRVIFYFAWSLATEEQFYLFWPWIVRWARVWYVPPMVMAGLLALRLGLEWGGASGNTLPLRMAMSIAPPICLGCLLAYALHRPKSFALVERVLGRPWSGALTAGATFAALALGLPEIVFYLAMAAWVGSCAVAPGSWLAPLLAHPVVRYIGTISYGMYLLHMIAMNAARRIVTQDAAVFALALVFSVALASVSYRLFERRFLLLKARFSQRRPPAPAGASLAAAVATLPEG